MRHAYLIIAHNDFEMLNALLSALDDERNDIYVHIDIKAKNYNENILKESVKFGNLHVYQEIDVRWGTESQVKCEMFLIKKAVNHRYHDYYHIISGVDYPIKSLDEIDAFFEKNYGKEFIHFDKSLASEEALDRVFYFHPFNKFYKVTGSKIIHRLFFVLDDLCVQFQKAFHKKKRLPFEIIQKGCNWCSITHDCAQYIIKSERKIETLVKKSRCADEVFIQTIVVNSKFINNLYLPTFNNDYRSCARLIVWDKNNIRSPKTLTLSDYQLIIDSEQIYARKLNSQISKELIQVLKQEVNK